MIKKLTKGFVSFRNYVIHSKIFLQRTMSWISIANAGMILFLVLSKFQDYGLELHITRWIIPIYLGFIVLLVVFGYVEDRLGFHREEKRAQESKSPYMKNVVKRLERMEKKINSIQRKVK